MAKSTGGRRAGSATRNSYAGGKSNANSKSIYGSTPHERLARNPNSLMPSKLETTNQAHQIGAPRGDK